MTSEFLREYFVGHSLIKEGDVIVGWGRRENELLAAGLSRKGLDWAVRKGQLDRIETVPEEKPGVPDLSKEKIIVYLFKAPASAVPHNVAD